MTAEVEGVQIEVTATAPLPVRQGALFQADVCDAAERELHHLLDRLTNRLGPKAVLRSQFNADHQPERAALFHPLLDARLAQKRSIVNVRHSASTRPLLLKASPRQVRVMAVAPDGPPVRFCWRNRDYNVARSWGPERIETGWWRGSFVRRDYYRVETSGGQRFWMFRRLDDGDWFLHGVFACLPTDSGR